MNKEEKQIKPMICPVCGKFYFGKLTQEDLDDGETPNSVQCSECGWFYDLEQTNDPNLKDQANKLSLNEFKKEYKHLKKENSKYNYLDAHKPEPTPHVCPVCGEHTFKDNHSFDICPVCGWEDDDVMEAEPQSWEGNTNDLCLNDYKTRYFETIKKNPSYKYLKDGIPVK